ncbi:hypothetical protein TDB9533_03042 [Thalassocella blandensis]|nr:hypothetical protein TDB9533_03042 [Thalassocella blandensis]
MDNATGWAIAAAAVGTLLLRVFPLIWMRHHLQQKSDVNAVENIPAWLSVLGPTMIAALLGVSLVPGHINASTVCATVVGSVATLLVWRWQKSLGWPIFSGVVVYGLVVYLGAYFL